MKRFSALLFFVLLLSAIPAEAQVSPVGRWKTIDEDTGKPKSVIRVVNSHGVLEGLIERLLDPQDPEDARCDLCPGDRRGQRIVGLSIIRNLHRVGSENKWDGGEILDPENGKTYRASMVLSPDGRYLDVRGYIGTPLLGRTQQWQRID